MTYLVNRATYVACVVVGLSVIPRTLLGCGTTTPNVRSPASTSTAPLRQPSAEASCDDRR